MTGARHLYHYTFGIPKAFQTNFGRLALVYGTHATRAAASDRYGRIELPRFLDTSAAKVIEVEGGAYDDETKVVYRVPYSAEYDLVLAVIPQSAFVKTVWLNHKADGHGTLDATKYRRPRLEET